jgi:hypothetical protein
MNHPRTRTAPALILFGCVALAACDHDEPGFALDGSLNAPLAPGQGYSLARTHAETYEIKHFAVSDDYLFFSSDWHGLIRMPKYGGSWDWVDEDSQAVVSAVTTNASEAFWVRSTFGPGDVPHTKVERRSATGGVTRIVNDGSVDTADSEATHGLLVDAGHVYALDVDRALIWAFPLEGGDPTQISFASLPPPAPNIPVFPNWVPDYPAMYFSDCLTSSPCALWKADTTDGSFANLMPLAGGPGGDAVQAVDEAFVYLIKGQHVVRMSKADLTISDVYVPDTGQAISWPLLVDDTNVYFTAYGPTMVQLLAAPKTGGPAQPLGWGGDLDHGIWEMTQDAAFVYVLAGPATDGGNEILMFPKTPAASTGTTP